MAELRLAVDNVTALPVSNLQDISAMCRRFADDLDAGEHGDVLRTVVVLQREDGKLALFGWGENTTGLELMGLFEAAKLSVFAEDFVEDE